MGEAAEDNSSMNDGGEAPDWREHLPESVRAWDEAKNAKDAEGFFQQMAAHRRMIGQSLRIPGKDAGDEAMNEFYGKVQSRVDGLMRVPDMEDDDQFAATLKKLGAPEEVTGYTDPELEGFDAKSEEYNRFKGMALKAGLTKKQFDRLAKSLAEREIEVTTTAKESKQNDVDALKGEWGNSYDHRMAVAANMAAKTGAPEALTDAIRSGQIDSATAKWMFELSQQLGGEIKNFSNSKVDQLTPQELQESIDDILGDYEGPYWNPKHPAHERYVKKVMDMRRQMA